MLENAPTRARISFDRTWNEGGALDLFPGFLEIQSQGDLVDQKQSFFLSVQTKGARLSKDLKL